MGVSPALLYEEYVDHGLTDSQIGLKYNADRTTVSKLRKEYAITTKETTGEKGEKIAVKQLTERGFKVENMNESSKTHPFDLLIDGNIRVDVKSSKVSKHKNFTFVLTEGKHKKCIESDNRIKLANGRTKKKYDKTCDLIMLVCIGEANNHFFIVPSKLIPINIQTIGIPLSFNGKYSVYKDRWDFLLPVRR